MGAIIQTGRRDSLINCHSLSMSAKRALISESPSKQMVNLSGSSINDKRISFNPVTNRALKDIERSFFCICCWSFRGLQTISLFLYENNLVKVNIPSGSLLRILFIRAGL